MASVYDVENFSGRVNYAAACFVRGTTDTRHFDTCFEMWDGDAVVVALTRRSWRNPRLKNAIASRYQGRFPPHWIATTARYGDVPTRQLPQLARQLRERRQIDAMARA